MMIAGLIVLLFILGLFLQALTSAPNSEAEFQIDTDAEVPTTPAHADEETGVLIA